MKRVLLVIGGITWLLIGTAIGWFTLRYLLEGAGLQLFGLGLSAGSVLLGWIHVVGMLLACGFAGVLGIGWLAYGLVSDRDQPARKD